MPQPTTIEHSAQIPLIPVVHTQHDSRFISLPLWWRAHRSMLWRWPTDEFDIAEGGVHPHHPRGVREIVAPERPVKRGLILLGLASSAWRSCQIFKHIFARRMRMPSRGRVRVLDRPGCLRAPSQRARACFAVECTPVDTLVRFGPIYLGSVDLADSARPACRIRRGDGSKRVYRSIACVN